MSTPLTPAAPRANRIFETCLYASDAIGVADFYQRVFGLELFTPFSTRLVALRCGASMLLIFNPAETRVDGGVVPTHGTTGAGHVAFLATATELPAWRAKLTECAVAIEREVHWPEGGTSLYMRDPAGNSVELAPPTLWCGLGL